MSEKIKYKIKTNEPIGSGSFSVVYKGIDKDGNTCAIKCISLEKLSQHNINKFLLELEISIKMKHPNIVCSMEVFKTKSNWYIVSEYCDGGTLSNIISNFNKYNPIKREFICKWYLTQLKNALKYLYKSGITHRDLKPSNILISGQYPHDTLKLADFGFSRYFNTDFADNTCDECLGDSPNSFMMTSFCGTPLYMAPELLIDKKYTNKADLWSFGIIMYEMLYGSNPYNYPKNINNLLDLIQNHKIEYNNIYSNECINLLKSLLQIKPNDRIEWDDFFKNEWFDKKIPSHASRDSLFFEHQQTSPRIHELESCDSDQNLDKEYDIIDTNDLSPCNYKSYNEVNGSYGFLKILSNSFHYLTNK